MPLLKSNRTDERTMAAPAIIDILWFSDLNAKDKPVNFRLELQRVSREWDNLALSVFSGECRKSFRSLFAASGFDEFQNGRQLNDCEAKRSVAWIGSVRFSNRQKTIKFHQYGVFSPSHSMQTQNVTKGENAMGRNEVRTLFVSWSANMIWPALGRLTLRHWLSKLMRICTEFHFLCCRTHATPLRLGSSVWNSKPTANGWAHFRFNWALEFSLKRWRSNGFSTFNTE